MQAQESKIAIFLFHQYNTTPEHMTSNRSVRRGLTYLSLPEFHVRAEARRDCITLHFDRRLGLIV